MCIRDSLETGHTGLDADVLGALGQVGVHGVQERRDVPAERVAVRGDGIPDAAAEQLVDGEVGPLAEDVPQGDVYGTDRRHGDRPTAPVGAAVQVLPDVLDAPRVEVDQQRRYVIGQVGRHGELATVDGGVTEADN